MKHSHRIMTPDGLPTLTPEDDVGAWESSSFDLRQGLEVIELPPTEPPPAVDPGEAPVPRPG